MACRLCVAALSLLLAGCNRPTVVSPPVSTTQPTVSAAGTIRAQGISSYMYGTHILADPSGKTLYALRSGDQLGLDQWVGQRVRIVGTIVPGYPVDGGPPFLDVLGVQATGP